MVFGFVSLELGPLGLIEALIVLGLVMVQVLRFPERTGAYLVGTSLLPVFLLGSIVTRMPSCPGTGVATATSQCYAPITVPVLLAYAVAGVGGAVLSWVALRRL